MGLSKGYTCAYREFPPYPNSSMTTYNDSDYRLIGVRMVHEFGVNIDFDRSVFLSLQDFATPSLTEQNTIFFTGDNAELERREIEQFQLRRRWESR